MNKKQKWILIICVTVFPSIFSITGVLTNWGQSKDGGATPSSVSTPISFEGSGKYWCVNGFKNYELGYMTQHPDYNNQGIIPCGVNEFLADGTVNQTMIDYYQNTFTGSQPKSFMLASNQTFDIMTISSSDQHIFLGTNNNQFLLLPSSGGFLEIIIQNYTSIDANATIKANHGLLGPSFTEVLQGYYPNEKPVLVFIVNISKPYLATITNPSESGMMGYAKVPLTFIYKQEKTSPIIYMNQKGVDMSNQPQLPFNPPEFDETIPIQSSKTIPVTPQVKEPSYYARQIEDIQMKQIQKLLAMQYCMQKLTYQNVVMDSTFEPKMTRCINETLERTK